MSLTAFIFGLDAEELAPTFEEAQAARVEEWEFRLENDLADEDAYADFCEARWESWLQDEIRDMGPEMWAECLAELQRREMANAEGLAARAERRSELRAMPYAEYLTTPEWARTKGAAKHRAGGRCYICNALTGLHVHHRTYERRGEEHDEDLVVLCWRCHGHFHRYLRLAH